jgi:hypothetical protein
VQHAVGPDNNGQYGYFVVWDDIPGVSVFIAGSGLTRPS